MDKIALYARTSWAPDKKQELPGQLKKYSIDALVNVAYFVQKIAGELDVVLEQQTQQIGTLELSLKGLSSRLSAAKRLAGEATLEKMRMPRSYDHQGVQMKTVALSAPSVASRAPLDFRALDNVGIALVPGTGNLVVFPLAIAICNFFPQVHRRVCCSLGWTLTVVPSPSAHLVSRTAIATLSTCLVHLLLSLLLPPSLPILRHLSTLLLLPPTSVVLLLLLLVASTLLLLLLLVVLTLLLLLLPSTTSSRHCRRLLLLLICLEDLRLPGSKLLLLRHRQINQ